MSGMPDRVSWRTNKERVYSSHSTPPGSRNRIRVVTTNTATFPIFLIHFLITSHLTYNFRFFCSEYNLQLLSMRKFSHCDISVLIHISCRRNEWKLCNGFKGVFSLVVFATDYKTFHVQRLRELNCQWRKIGLTLWTCEHVNKIWPSELT